MRHERRSLQVKLEVATGDASVVRQLIDKWLTITGTFSATLQVEVSLDEGATWFITEEDVDAVGLFEIPEAASHIRIDTTVYVSGTPVASLAARNAETSA